MNVDGKIWRCKRTLCKTICTISSAVQSISTFMLGYQSRQKPCCCRKLTCFCEEWSLIRIDHPRKCIYPPKILAISNHGLCLVEGLFCTVPKALRHNLQLQSMNQLLFRHWRRTSTLKKSRMKDNSTCSKFQHLQSQPHITWLFSWIICFCFHPWGFLRLDKRCDQPLPSQGSKGCQHSKKYQNQLEKLTLFTGSDSENKCT
jgi:hypothetical protein